MENLTRQRNRILSHLFLIIGLSFIVAFAYLTRAQEYQTPPSDSSFIEGSFVLDNEQSYLFYLETLPTLTDAQIKENMETYESRFGNASYDKRGEAQLYLIATKIEYFNRQLDRFCASEYDHNQARFARTELRRLESLETFYEKPEARHGYRCPQDLFYGFLNYQNVYVSQTTRTHYSRNGFLATDVATKGVKELVYAPDLYNNPVCWDVEFLQYTNDTVGKALVFVNGRNKILFGHINDWNGKDHACTGEIVGRVGGCGDAENEGVSTGCHLHIEYYLYDEVKADWVIYEYSFNNSNKHDETNEEPDPEPISSNCVEYSGSRYVTPDINDEWFYRDPYGNWKGFQGYYPDSPENRKAAYNADFKVNCSGDCTIGAMGLKITPGWSVACDPKYPFGTRFTINGREFECMDRGGAIKDAKRGAFAIDFYVTKDTWNDYEGMLQGTACFK